MSTSRLDVTPSDDSTRTARGYGASPTDELEVGRVLHALQRHWRRVAVGLAIALGITLAYLRLATRRYEATTTVLIDARTSKLPSIYAEQTARDEVFTEIEVMRGRSIAADVVDSQALQVELLKPSRVPRSNIFKSLQVTTVGDTGTFRLVRRREGGLQVEGSDKVVIPGKIATVAGVTFDLDPQAAEHGVIEVRVRPREEAIAALRRSVDIGRAGLQASVIALRYESTDPVLARDVLNSWTSRFIQRRHAIQRADAASTSAFIQAQLDTLVPKLTAAEAKLLTFRDANKIVAPDFEANTQVSQRALLQASRNELESERSSLQQALSRVRAQGTATSPDSPSPYRELLGFPSMLRNQAASELLRSLASLEDQRTQLLMRRTAADPDVVTVSERIRAVETQLQGLTTTYLRGLTAEVASADQSLGAYNAKLQSVPSQEIEYARLQRAPKQYDELVSLLQTRLKEAQISEAATDGSVRVVDEAVTPDRPSSPNPPLVLAFGAVGGLMLGFVLAFVRERGRQTVRSRNDLQRLSDTPVLGLIPTFSLHDRREIRRAPRDPSLAGPQAAQRAGTQLARSSTPSELAANEAYTRLLLNVKWAASEPVRSLLISSPLPGDGKTTTAIRLAAAAAGQQQRVLLVDADLRRGGLTAALDLREQRGLVDFLNREATLADCTTAVVLSGRVSVDAIGAGSLSRDADVTLLLNGFVDLLSASDGYDLVIVDTSPINIVADAAALATLTDGVLLVARSGETSPVAIDVALEQLERAGARLLGTVLNGAEFHRADGYGSMTEYRTYTLARS